MRNVATCITALVKQVHTIEHVSQLSKNVITKRNEKNLQDSVKTLKGEVLLVGNQVQNVKVRLTVFLYLQFKWICVSSPTNDALR